MATLSAIDLSRRAGGDRQIGLLAFQVKIHLAGSPIID